MHSFNHPSPELVFAWLCPRSFMRSRSMLRAEDTDIQNCFCAWMIIKVHCGSQFILQTEPLAIQLDYSLISSMDWESVGERSKYFTSVSASWSGRILNASHFVSFVHGFCHVVSLYQIWVMRYLVYFYHRMSLSACCTDQTAAVLSRWLIAGWVLLVFMESPFATANQLRNCNLFVNSPAHTFFG